jgi:GNAT superfamily N-acetyltransferase
MFVAVQDEKIVGIISGKIEKPISILIEPRLTGMITRAYVDDSYRRKGIGRQMMTTMLDWFRNKGVQFANIGSIGANKIGTKVWKNLGFEIESYRLVTKL